MLEFTMATWSQLILIATIVMCVWTLAYVYWKKREVQPRGFEVIVKPEEKE
jgi:hypothetical protein